MKRDQFGAVQKPLGAEAVEGQKVAELLVAVTQTDTASGAAEGAKYPVNVPKHPVRAETGTRRDLRDEAGLVAELGTG